MTQTPSRRANTDVTSWHLAVAKDIPAIFVPDPERDAHFLQTKAGQRYAYALAAFLAASRQHDEFMGTRPSGERSDDSLALDIQGQITSALVLGKAAQALSKAASAKPVRQYRARISA